MADREATPMDQAVFDATLQAELAKGTDRRVAEGRARAAGVRAYRKAHPEAEAEHAAPARPAAAAVPAGNGEAAAPAAAAATQVPAAVGAPLAYAAPAPAALRTAPPPTGRVPSPKPGTPDKHRLLALV